MFGRLSAIFCGLILSSQVLVPAPVRADTMKDVANSEQMAEFEAHGFSTEIMDGLPPHTNLYNIFRNPALMVEWIEAFSPGFKHEKVEASANRELAWAWKTFRGSEENLLYKVTVEVPHPRFLKQLDIGLMPELSKFEPPTLKVESSEPIDVKGTQGTLYFRTDGTCSILMKITKRGLVNVEGPSCKRVDELIKLANMLDVRRLQEKLDS